ncbi:ArsI/CadI family heavy metal resistance metalloenzyme [Kitasatospora sp. NPDC006697]|uniref:ArsI/CadI family heavy metal resistance metalloenzyme n=1 Tax=Kitasatospora sp. NPDC006697 TaxID=3364020 RepID=UPI003674229D
MSRVQLALRVADLEASVAFYAELFGTEPAKRRPGYANFAIAEPPLKLVLIEGEAGHDTRLDHLGIEVDSTEQVAAAGARLQEAGLATFDGGGTSRPKAGGDTSCCYALQDKTWVTGPGREPWEVYVVKADAETFGERPEDQAPDDRRAASGCCLPTGPAIAPAAPAAAAGCCG